MKLPLMLTSDVLRCACMEKHIDFSDLACPFWLKLSMHFGKVSYLLQAFLVLT